MLIIFLKHVTLWLTFMIQFAVATLSLWHFLFSKMPRHARNCTAGSVYTYHEKMKDAQQSGYGTLSMRLGKDSIKVRQELYSAIPNLLVEQQWKCNVWNVINYVICLSFILGQSVTLHHRNTRLFLASEDSIWIWAFIAFSLQENWVQMFSSCIQINTINQLVLEYFQEYFVLITLQMLQLIKHHLVQVHLQCHGYRHGTICRYP